MERIFTTNSRLVNELFANYISTFAALCELINNSIQAKAKNIWLNIDYTPDNELSPLIIKQIVIKDDGQGVYINDLDKKFWILVQIIKKEEKVLGVLLLFK